MDQVTGLLESLAQLGVKMAVDDGQLKISAAKGVLTGELRSRLLESKDEILRRLQGLAPTAAAPAPARIAPDPQADHLPFPLSDLQLGFYIANDPYMELHVRPHYYFEFDHVDLDRTWPVGNDAGSCEPDRRHGDEHRKGVRAAD